MLTLKVTAMNIKEEEQFIETIDTRKKSGEHLRNTPTDGHISTHNQVFQRDKALPEEKKHIMVTGDLKTSGAGMSTSLII